MFRSSHGKKDSESDSMTSRSGSDGGSSDTNPSSPGKINIRTDNLSPVAQHRNSPLSAKKPDDGNRSPEAGKKRRTSGTAKAKEIFSTAKNSILHGDKDFPQTPLQKLSKTDAALGVPQGSFNNSAGESHPTPRSSFHVGVTEDRNKKCRRTMEDTHAYLYNFLGTPAPVLPASVDRPGLVKGKRSNESKESSTREPSEALQYVVETDNGYFAIFDGHAGTFAAEWCGKKLHIILEDLMRKNPNSSVPELLDQAYTTADGQLEKLPLRNSGCTAITAVLRWEDRIPNSHSATGSTTIATAAAAATKAAEAEAADSGAANDPSKAASAAESVSLAVQKFQETATRQRVLYTANVGDARIILCRNGKALRLSYDHKGGDEAEGKRITKAGGLILNNRVNGVLAVTRALGDSYLKDLVTGHPYTTETVIQHDQDEFLILACDGVSRCYASGNALLISTSSGMSARIKKQSTLFGISRILRKPPRYWSTTHSPAFPPITCRL